MTEYTKGELRMQKYRGLDAIYLNDKCVAKIAFKEFAKELVRRWNIQPDLLAACEATKNILEDINFRHSNKKSFHNNRIAADSSTGIEILINAIAKAKPK